MQAEDRAVLEECIWSGPAQELGLPVASYLPCAFWLNAVRGEEVSATAEDTWLDPSELEEVRKLQSESGEDAEVDIEIVLSDPRCLLPASVNGPRSVRLRDLSRASLIEVDKDSDARAILLTTFDEPDIDWAIEELGLHADAELTLCMHAWTSLGSDPVCTARQALWAHFDDAEVVLPSEIVATSGSVPEARAALEAPCPAKLAHLWALYGLTELESWWHEREQWWPSSTWDGWDWEDTHSCRAEHPTDVVLDHIGAVVLPVKLMPGVGKPRLPREGYGPLIRVELRRKASWELWLFPPASPAEGSVPCGVDEQVLGYIEGLEACAVCDALFALELLDVCGPNSLSGFCRPLASLDRQTGGLSASELLLAVPLQHHQFSGAAPRQDLALGPMFGALATNYGLLGLEKAVESLEEGAGAWPMAEEVRFCSMSSAIGGLQGQWLRDLDISARRGHAHGRHEGPFLVVPPPPYSEYNSLSSADPNSLCEHSAPWHAPGREQIARVHNKLLVRHMRTAAGGMPYGWTYLGSHNLTQAAWGTLRYPSRDAVWMSNWELGVVTGTGRPSENDEWIGSENTLADVSPFRHSPFPFGLPLANFQEAKKELDASGEDGSTYAEVEGVADAGDAFEEYKEFKEHCLLHPKLLLFEHDDRLRVCIGTANLRRQSWDFQAEAVWVRDFPLRPSVANVRTGEDDAGVVERDAILALLRDPFARNLAHFLAMLLQSSPGRRERWLRRLLCYDFTGANALLVASVPGSHPLIPFV
mmetsp:Transcript_130160/g.278145  ORF Transcript_130160/g.278145 Transcript_130160/m.278145 type:complete len:760 (+) Transcript_130160:50-2329(+)